MTIQSSFHAFIPGCIIRTVAAIPYFALLGLMAAPANLSAVDGELSNLRSGISLTWSGQRGTDYQEEYFYHDKAVNDRKVVYIKSSTLIEMTHNERNVAGKEPSGTYYKTIGAHGLDGIPNSGDEGVIRYWVDGDLHWGYVWSSYANSSKLAPAYAGAISFDTLAYPSATPESGKRVLGSVGSNGRAVTDKINYFTFGIRDSVGDEWHSIQVGDDDHRIVTTDNEWLASDGKIFYFVVNPKTPCLVWRSSGGGQFYTTPPKNYHIPKIHDQITYIDSRNGSVTVEISDINGKTIFYRIGSSGAFTKASGSSVVLSHERFPIGQTTLEYYYEGNEAFTKKRTVVRNPSFPSAEESHGLLLFGSDDLYSNWVNNEVRGDGSELGKGLWWKRFREGKFVNRAVWDSLRGKGGRRIMSEATIHALLAKELGATAAQTGQKSFAWYAKDQLLENTRRIDPVGVHMAHGQTQLPSREIIYRGYFDVSPVVDMIFAYDILISFFKSTDYNGGITPIEDFYIRDSIADFVFESICNKGLIYDPTGNIDTAGMWETSRACAAVVGTLALPNYSSHYYGSSGVMPSAMQTYAWVPFQSDLYTWKQVLIENDKPIRGYPNMSKRLGIEEYMCLPSGVFNDRPVYFGHVGKWMGIAATMIKRNSPSIKFPNFEKSVALASAGELTGVKGSDGKSRFATWSTYNRQFPDLASVGVSWISQLDKADPLSDDQLANGGLPLMWGFYEQGYESVSALPNSPSALRVEAR